MPQYLKIFELY